MAPGRLCHIPIRLLTSGRRLESDGLILYDTTPVLSYDERTYWDMDDGGLNKELDGQRATVLPKVGKLPSHSHLGSSDPKLFLDMNDVFGRLRSPESDMMEMRGI